MFISDNFPLLFINNKYASQLGIEPANENKQFKETKTWILYLINSYLMRQSFKEYREKSGIVIFAWRVTYNYTLTVPLRVTYNYAYSPLKS